MFKFMSILTKILSSKQTVNTKDVEEGIDSLIKTLALAKTFSGEAVKLSDWIAGSTDEKVKEGVNDGSNN